MDTPHQGSLRITTTAELLKAVELGIVDKTEARGLLGFAVKRGRLASVQPRTAGRFTKDEVLPFNRFSSQAKQALLLAQEEASAAGRPQVATADLLLAVLQQETSVAIRALAALGIGLAGVRSQLAAAATTEDAMEGIGTTAQLRAATRAAFDSVAYPDEITPEHLLVSLATNHGMAQEALTALGATAGAIRAEIDRLQT